MEPTGLTKGNYFTYKDYGIIEIECFVYNSFRANVLGSTQRQRIGGYIEDLEPIPLTKELLLKLGIKPETNFNGIWLKYNGIRKDWRVWNKGVMIIRIKYAHELQHLYSLLKKGKLKFIDNGNDNCKKEIG